MLAYRYRFHGHRSLRYVYRNGKVARSRLFIMRYAHNGQRVHPRFAVIVAKKVIKSAVKRNRIRRRVYEVLRLELPDFDIAFDASFTVVKPEVGTMPLPELQKEIRELLRGAGVYKKTPHTEDSSRGMLV